MLKTLVAIVFAAGIAGAITGFPDIVEPVAAEPTAIGAIAVAAPACPGRGWPYRHCGAEGAGHNGVRLISTDRLH